MQLKFEEIVELIHREMYVRNGVMLGSKAAARAIMQAEEAAQQSVQPTVLTAFENRHLFCPLCGGEFDVDLPASHSG